MNDNKKQHPLTQTLLNMFGQQSTLVIHKPILQALNGDHVTALFAEQLIYWQARSNNEGGWVVKSYDEWFDEIMLSARQIKRAVEILKAWGLETNVKRSSYHRGGATLYYRLNTDIFIQKLTTEQNVIITKGKDEIVTKGNYQIMTKGEDVYIDSHETTTKTTFPDDKSSDTRPTVSEVVSSHHDSAKSGKVDNTQSKKTHKVKEPTPKKERPRNLYFDAIVSAFGYNPERLTKSQNTLIGMTANELKSAGYTPDDIAVIYAYCKRTFKGLSFSAKALAKHASDAIKSRPAQSTDNRQSAPTTPNLPAPWELD